MNTGYSHVGFSGDCPAEDYQAILQAIRDKESSKRNWLKGIAILGISLFIFFQLGMVHWGLTFVLMILVVVAFHELGHYVGMRAFGYKNIQMFFIPLAGAAVSGTGRNVAAWKKALVTLMGPLPGIGIGVMLAVLVMLGVRDAVVPMAMMFLVLNLLNLVPITPLDGGRFLHEVLFSRSHYLDVVMNVLAGAILLIAGILLKDWIFGLLGVLNLMGTGHRFKMAAAAKKMRAELMASDPSLFDDTDAETIPDDALGPMVAWMRQHMPATQKPNDIATTVLELWERVRILPPGAGATAGLLVLYLSGLVASVFGFVLLAAADPNRGFEGTRTEIVSVVDDDGQTRSVEHAYRDGKLYSTIGLTDDRRYYHGEHCVYHGDVIIEEGTWDQGRRAGKWSFRDSKGQAYYEIVYAEEGRPALFRVLEDREWIESTWEEEAASLKKIHLDAATYQQGPGQ